MTTPQTTRPMVMWRVTLHCWQEGSHVYLHSNEVVDVEAPENDLRAAAQAGMKALHSLGFRGQVHRIDVWRLDDRTPPSELARQNSLWDAAMGAESEAQP